MESKAEIIFGLKQELSAVKLAPLWSDSSRQYSDLGEFIDAYTRYDETKKVLVWAGHLGAGKTRHRKKAYLYRKMFYQLYGRNQQIGTRTWEYGENRARLAAKLEGRFFTPKGKPLNPDELDSSSQNLGEGISDSIFHYADTEVETPLLTSVNIENDPEKPPRFEGRELGLKALYNLVRFQGEEFFKLPPCAIWIAGTTAGPYLRAVVPPFRDGIRDAQSLKEAQALAILCGLDHPCDALEWRAMKLDGASVEETDEVDQQFEREVIPVYQRMRPYSYSQYSRMVVEADMMDHICSNDYNLGLTPDRYFIGSNDPELYSPNKRLLDDFVNSRGKLRLSEVQIRDLLFFNHITKAAD